MDFIGLASHSVLLPLPYPDSSYMVVVDGYDSVSPYVSNKQTTGFDVTYPDGQNHTLTVFYKIYRK